MKIINSNIGKVSKKKTIPKNKNITFKGKANTFETVACAGMLTFGTILGVNIYNLCKDLNSFGEKHENKEVIVETSLSKPVENQIGWNKNIKVIASVPQDYKGTGSYNFSDKNYGSDFMRAFIPVAKKSDNFEATADTLIKKGYANTYYKNSIHYPVATPRNFGLFNKKDMNKTRFAIVIDGATNKMYSVVNAYANKTFSRDCELLKKDLNKEYNCPDSNIVSVNIKDFGTDFWASRKAKKGLKNAVDYITEKIQKSNSDLKNVELMIFYSGHGEVEKKIIPFSKEYEGSSKGLWDAGEFKIKESFMKKLLNKNPVLKKIKGILIVNDSCHSGAWIAKAQKTGGKLLKQV